MFWDIDVKGGIVEFDDISFLPEDFRVAEHVDFLKEDMLQIRYPGDVLVDVSWRPTMRVRGKFHIVAIQDSAWDCPLIEMWAADVVGVKTALRKIILLVGSAGRIDSCNQ